KSARSQDSSSALPPAAAIALAVCPSAAGSMSAIAVLAPSRASVIAIAEPSPPPAPSTSAVFPFNTRSMILLCAQSPAFNRKVLAPECNPFKIDVKRMHFLHREAAVPGAAAAKWSQAMTKGLRKGLTSYGDEGFALFLRKAFIKAMGYSNDALSRPIVGITNTYSDYNPCHGNVPALIEAVKRGVMLAGAMPMVFPTLSIHESFAHPTSMYLRNLMAIETEEMLRAQPMDAVVAVGGCDKTLPAQIMAAVSANLPTVVLPTGSMVVGHHKGEVLGACTDCRRLWSAYRAGEIGDREIDIVSCRLAPSVGTCM